MKSFRPGIIVFIIIACFLTRLPLLLNPGLILDGDECVLATMAKHISEGRGFPLFFYGQNYGLAIIEVLVILMFSIAGGVTTLAVKLAMLSLWTTGVVFFYLALGRLKPKWKWLPLLLTILLIVTPGWATLSMRALGGYLTSFTLSSICLYLLFDRKESGSGRNLFIIGTLTAIISQSQFLWLPGLLPFILYALWKLERRAKAMYFIVPFIAIFVSFYLYKQGLPTFHISARFNPEDVLIEYLARIPRFIYTTMHGHHDLWMTASPGTWSGTFAIIMTCVTLLIPLFLLLSSFRSGKVISLRTAAALSVVCSFAYSIFTYHIQGRYLLPLIGYTLLALCIFLCTTSLKVWTRSVLVAVVCLGVIGISTFRIFPWPETKPATLDKVLAKLKEKNVRAVYCTHGMLTWQLTFYSSETIMARPGKWPGRYQPYANFVESARRTGLNTAVVGYADPGLNDFECSDCELVDDMFIYWNPAKEGLSTHFELPEGK